MDPRYIHGRFRKPDVALKQKTAHILQTNDKSAKFRYTPPEDTTRNMASYHGKYIIPKGRLILAIESKGGFKKPCYDRICVGSKNHVMRTQFMKDTTPIH